MHIFINNTYGMLQDRTVELEKYIKDICFFYVHINKLNELVLESY